MQYKDTMKRQIQMHKKSISKRIKHILMIIGIVIAVLAAAFLIYTSFYYRADSTAVKILETDSRIKTDENLTILPSDNFTQSTTASDDSAQSPMSSDNTTYSGDTGFIFYPGANVEAVAYLPLLEKIEKECGITCVLVKMPFNMAVFDENAADHVINEFPNIKKWYIGGHSLGGAIASMYAAKHQDKVQGLILMGAYLSADYPGSRTLVIYGSLNTAIERHLKGTEYVVKIEGGNHAEFGNYGRQFGDAEAAISREEQQTQTKNAVKEFIQ